MFELFGTLVTGVKTRLEAWESLTDTEPDTLQIYQGMVKDIPKRPWMPTYLKMLT